MYISALNFHFDFTIGHVLLVKNLQSHVLMLLKINSSKILHSKSNENGERSRRRVVLLHLLPITDSSKYFFGQHIDESLYWDRINLAQRLLNALTISALSRSYVCMCLIIESPKGCKFFWKVFERFFYTHLPLSVSLCQQLSTGSGSIFGAESGRTLSGIKYWMNSCLAIKKSERIDKSLGIPV